MIWLALDTAFFAFACLMASKTRGANFAYLALLWGAILFVALADLVFYNLFNDYISFFYILSISLTSLVIALDLMTFNKMSRLLLFFMIAQCAYWLTMLLHYRDFPNHHLFNFITNNTREIAVLLATAQIMAALNGDTNIFDKIFRRITSIGSGACLGVARSAKK